MCYLKKNGTYDLIGNNGRTWEYVTNKMVKVCEIYNFNYIKTPLFEDTNLFFNMIGKNTDVISKELYEINDKNKENISLRPEGTTGVIRSYLENKMYLDNNVSKFFYYGSMFRNENVEKGRYREFQQFGVEVFNNNSYLCDVEIILLAFDIFKSLGLNDIKIYINNLGSKENKKDYENVLRKYFYSYKEYLCDDCKKRLEENPIRILDCKIDKRNDFILDAPKIDDYINKESKEHFEKVLESLDQLNIPYEINRNLVRGLNYYTNTVFEIKTDIDGYGSANTICGGGRYNETVITDEKQIIPAMGFAIGIERLIEVLKEKNLLNDIYKSIDYNLLFEDIELLNLIRNMGYVSDYNSNDFSKYTIDKSKDKYVIIDNLKNNKVSLTREQLINLLKNS